MKRSLRTRKENEANSRRQTATSPDQGLGSTVDQANATQMDYQIHERESLVADASSKAVPELDYQSCLKECICQFSDKENLVAVYKGYPQPSEKIWSECLKTAREFAGQNRDALDCMCAYELLLIDQGVATVSVKLSNGSKMANTRPMVDLVNLKQFAKYIKEDLDFLRKIKRKFIAKARQKGMPRSWIQLNLARIF